MSEEQDQKTKAFLEQVHRTLDESVDNLDEITRVRLQAARRTAMQEVRQRRLPGYSIFAGVTATVVLALFMIPFLSSPDRQQDGSFVEDVSVLSATEELEFYDDLEFYRWLEDTQES